MIGRYLEVWEDSALRRVHDTPIELWFDTTNNRHEIEDSLFDLGYSGHEFEVVCLYGFVPEKDSNTDWDTASSAMNQEHGPGQYDRLVIRFGVERVVRAIKMRALKILLSRHPLEMRALVAEAGR